MSFDVPIQFEKHIEQYAHAEHISNDEAIARLLQVGLEHSSPGTKTPAQEMWGAFSSPDDRAMLDEIVAEAYALRLADQPRDSGL